MEIRNRMADVIKLRCNACQYFLSMIIKPGWQRILYEEAQKAVVNDKNKNAYIADYEKMRDKGIDNYQVSDMDVSFIVEVIRNSKCVNPIDKRTKDALSKLREDRNLTFHSNENESDEELYLRGLMALCDLRSFVRTVDNIEKSIDDEHRLKFRNCLIPEIDRLKEIIDDERIQIVQKSKERKRDIQRILESENPGDEWLSVMDYYLSRVYRINGNFDDYDLFVIESAEAGIVQAYSSAANYYINHSEFDKAERYLYTLLYNPNGWHIDPDDMMKLADIYFKGLSSRKGDGQRIIDSLIDKGSVVKSEDGKRYELISRAEATQGKCLFSIDIPQ